MSGGYNKGRLVVNTTYAQPELRTESGHLVAALEPYQVENARRLVACWNACEALPTEALVGSNVTALRRSGYPLLEEDVIKDVMRQRDELLHAMRLIQHATAPTPDDGGYHENAYELATGAIDAYEDDARARALGLRTDPQLPAGTTGQTS